MALEPVEQPADETASSAELEPAVNASRLPAPRPSTRSVIAVGLASSVVIVVAAAELIDNWVKWAAIGGMLAAAGTGLLALVTWRLARGSDDQVRATIELADATRANVAISERAFQLQIEPHVLPVPDVDPKIAWKPASDGIATVTLQVQNVGNGVAEIVKLEVSCAAEASGQPTMDRVLPSGAKATIEADFQLRPPRQTSGAPSTWTGQPHFPAWPTARLDYKGVDGRVFTRGIAWRNTSGRWEALLFDSQELDPWPT